MKRAAVASIALLAACAPADGPTRPDARPSSPPAEVTRVLDFSAGKTESPVAVRLPYGEGRRRVGYLPPCTRRSCPPPCPCSTRLQATSFDVGSGGDVWVLDHAKGRLASFDAGGEFQAAQSLSPLAYRAWDVQLEGGRPFALAQNHDFDTQIVFVTGEGSVRRRVFFGDAPVEAGGSINVIDGTGYVLGWIPEGADDREVLLQVPLDPEARELDATEASGRPMLDGRLLHKTYEGPRLIPLEYEGATGSWATDLRLLTKRSRDAQPEDRGNVSWEIEVGPDGTIHLLVLAGLAKRSDYWYLRVSPEGEVGDAVPLSGPRIEDDQQSRHLTLDEDGDPFVMWAGRNALLIVPLDTAP